MMEQRKQPKTATEMPHMRKGRKWVLLAIIAGLVALCYLLTLIKVGGAS